MTHMTPLLDSLSQLFKLLRGQYSLVSMAEDELALQPRLEKVMIHRLKELSQLTGLLRSKVLRPLPLKPTPLLSCCPGAFVVPCVVTVRVRVRVIV